MNAKRDDRDRRRASEPQDTKSWPDASRGKELDSAALVDLSSVPHIQNENLRKWTK